VYTTPIQKETNPGRLSKARAIAGCKKILIHIFLATIFVWLTGIERNVQSLVTSFWHGASAHNRAAWCSKNSAGPHSGNGAVAVVLPAVTTEIFVASLTLCITTFMIRFPSHSTPLTTASEAASLNSWRLKIKLLYCAANRGFQCVCRNWLRGVLELGSPGKVALQLLIAGTKRAGLPWELSRHPSSLLWDKHLMFAEREHNETESKSLCKGPWTRPPYLYMLWLRIMEIESSNLGVKTGCP
jgi:hypothetical protein